MRSIIKILLSVKTTFVLFIIFILFAFIGSVELPGNLSFFSGIDDEPLFNWLSHNHTLSKTWWIYALILTLGLIAINTIFCTVEALIKRVRGRNLIAKLCPQLMHIGVLLVMLGHLLTASNAFRTEINIKKGQSIQLPSGKRITVVSIKEYLDEEGFATDWTVEIVSGRKNFSIKPLKPVKIDGYHILAQAVEKGTAVIRIIKDPGAMWALSGGALLCLAAVVFITSRSII